jgi:hypothetical protein
MQLAAHTHEGISLLYDPATATTQHPSRYTHSCAYTTITTLAPSPPPGPLQTRTRYTLAAFLAARIRIRDGIPDIFLDWVAK